MSDQKILTAEDLIQIKAGNGPQNNGAKEEYEPAQFQADDLNAVFTDAEGNVVLEGKMTARGFKPKQHKTTKAVKGGIGWYSGELTGKYRGLDVNCGLRVSVAKVKLDPGTPVDLRSDTTKAEDAADKEAAE